MDALKIAKLINMKIQELEELKSKLDSTSHKKALSMALYDKIMAKTMISLRNGGSFEIDGIAVKEESASLVEKMSRGICYKEKIEMDLAESDYKNVIKIIDITQAQLNGYQSVNRYLSEM